ncbi:MAG: hypothetical protein J0H40_04270 [Rhizobiales bacterium]|nr:hypothetical protein [Hyphomicrobiales bacterium]
MTKPPPSATQIARTERMQQAAIEGAKARADIEAHDIAVRKNMERLRALRLAKEAEEATRPKPVKAKAGSKKKTAATATSLAGWMNDQRNSGRAT